VVSLLITTIFTIITTRTCLSLSYRQIVSLTRPILLEQGGSNANLQNSEGDSE
jgi:hypothetical protein